MKPSEVLLDKLGYAGPPRSNPFTDSRYLPSLFV